MSREAYFAGKVAVVTGAGSGIGRALAQALAARGARLAICDVNAGGLAQTAGLVKEAGAEVHAATVDVSDRAAVAAYAAAVREHYGVVHQLYNNAGITGGGEILLTGYELFEKVLGVNMWGVLHATKEFLPHLIDSGDGHLVNLSSLNGILAQPDATPYCMSKFAVRGLTESLRGEMLAHGLPVKVTVVHPGGVATSIAANALFFETADPAVIERYQRKQKYYQDKLLKMPPARAAEIIVAGVEKGAPRVLVGSDAKWLDRLVRHFPAAYLRLVVAAERRAWQ